MKKYIQSITIIVLLILNFILLIRFKKNNLEEVNKLPAMDRLNFIHNVEMSTEKNGKTFNYDQIVISETRDTVLFIDLIQDRTLIFYFKQSSCLPCVNESVSLLNDLWLSQNITNVAILTDVNDFNELLLFKKVNDISCPVYKIDCYLLDSNVPIFFTLDNDLILKNLYAVFPGNPDITKRYLSSLLSNELIY